ncbi:MAG: hypothetical protein CM15mP84_04970 [Cellvibrionales bacterium]|nr:MAG: hypothetical protein CM15mP84_04970 [Cellvibrionales bacterium]
MRFCEGLKARFSGKTRPGGGINVITKAPTFDDFYGSADLTLGEYSLVKPRAAMNTPFFGYARSKVSVMSQA